MTLEPDVCVTLSELHKCVLRTQRILAMPSTSKGRGSRRPAPREDVEAVLNLPDHVPGALTSSGTTQKEANAAEA